MSLSMRAKVTNVRLTALSISSTHMNITSTLRRMRRPTAPMVNRAAARVRYHARERSRASVSCRARLDRSLGPRTAGQHDGADHGDHEQDRRDLEREQVAGEDRPGQLLDVLAGPA